MKQLVILMASKTLILVEDDFLIRFMVSEILIENVYTVIEAEHSDTALATLKARAAEIHLLFTDVHMPGRMDGMILAHRAQRSYNDT